MLQPCDGDIIMLQPCGADIIMLQCLQAGYFRHFQTFIISVIVKKQNNNVAESDLCVLPSARSINGARWRRTSRTEVGASRICPARCPPDTKAKSGSWSGGGRPSQAVNSPQACAVSKYSTPDETHEIYFLIIKDFSETLAFALL